jgi:hypothetical protein
VLRKYLILSGKKELAVGWGGGGDCPIRRKEMAVTSIFYPFLKAFIMLTEIVMLTDELS